MKLYSLYIIIYLFSLLYCNDSKKDKITEDYIYSILNDLYPEIKNIFEYLKYDKIFINETILFTIPEFTLDKIQINIKDDGIVNLKLRDIIPSLRKEIPRISKLCVVRHLFVLLNDFEMEINIKKIENDLKIVEEPIINYRPEVHSNYNLMLDLFNSMIENGTFNDYYVVPIIKYLLDEILSIIINKFHKD